MNKILILKEFNNQKLKLFIALKGINIEYLMLKNTYNLNKYL